ncbi:MAG: Tetratricopeptide repeat [Pseudomonadota bacterium]|jgi:tetratricopeptide (TPR) repeat protein
MRATLQAGAVVESKRWSAILAAGRRGHVAVQRELALQYVQRHPDEVWGWVMLAHTLGLLWQFEQARAALVAARALASAEELAEVWLQSGLLCEAQGSLPRAVRWYRKALSRKTTSRGLLLLAGAYVRRGELVEAKVCYERALRRAEPGRAEARGQLGLLYRAQGKYAAALRALDAALVMDAREATARDARADVQAALQQTKASLPPEPERGRALLLAASQRGHFALQRDLGLRYVQAQPRDFRGWLLLANALAALASYGEASLGWRRALRLAPPETRPAIWVLWGRMCAEQGALGLAVRHYRKALALQVQGEWLTSLGAALARQGDFVGARRALQRALQRTSGRDEAGTEEAHYQLALVQRAERDPVAALSSLDAALALSPRHALARVARQDVRRALQLQPL